MMLTDFIRLVIEAYVNYPSDDLLLVISGFLYIIPTILAVYYYNKVGSLDYLIIGVITLIMFLDGASLPLRDLYGIVSPLMDEIIVYLVYYTGVIAIPFTLLHCVRYKWGNHPQLLIGVFCIFLILFVRSTLIIYFNDVLAPFGFYRDLLFEIIRTLAGLFWVYVYFTTEPVIKYDRIRIPRTLWVSYGFYAIILGSLGILREFHEEFGFTKILPQLTEILWDLSVFAAILTLLVIETWFPEMFFLSEVQILHARRLYEVAKMANCGSETVEKDKLLAHMCKYLKEAKELVNK